MKIKAIRGTKDILPEHTARWCFIEEKAKALCELYGYRQIRTPLLEEARLFTRSIGTSSDIVSKQMYTFVDHKKRTFCLRPEATASVVRAYLEHSLHKNISLAKFYYLGPMFRAERPQAGRLRQFHHIGVETIGSANPYLDGEVISLAVNILREIGVRNFTTQLNSIGCQKDRKRYEVVLKESLKDRIDLLCSDCHHRYKKNLLRIFDCKNVTCKKITHQLPSIYDSLCSECTQHFLKVQQILNSLNISYELNSHLVRGLDYYTKTCFEIIHTNLGAQNALGAGGRYDDLVSDLGGPQRPAVGFALGIERIINALAPSKDESYITHTPYVYIATIGEGPKQLAFKILQSLRKHGISSDIDYQGKSLKGQMRQADKTGFKYVVILGEDELKKRIVLLRDMQNKKQKEVKLSNLNEELMAQLHPPLTPSSVKGLK